MKGAVTDKLSGIIREDHTDPRSGILHHEENVDLLPANIELSAMEMMLVTAMSRETILRSYLSKVKDNYDYVLIDCMPSLGMVTLNALAAADSVIIPVQAQYLPAKGMTQLMQTIGKVRQYINPSLRIDGRVISILKTNVDARSDDMMLYLLVCNSFYSNENSVGKMPFEVVMKNYKELELPHFESVRRTRAKIQSEHPELACSPECRKARKRMQHLYSNYVMN